MDMTKIGFLSFGHWRDVPGSKVRSGREALAQAIDLAVAAEEAGVDGAYFRVHHFAPQQAAPFPLLSAIAVLELIATLAVGAEVTLASEEEKADGQALRRLVEARGTTLMQATPATWRLLFDAGGGWVVRASAQLPLSDSHLNGNQDEKAVLNFGI